MRKLFFSQSPGFTLIEIMIAISIFAVSIVSIYAAQGNSLRASGRAEQIQTASLLSRQIMTLKILELQKEMEKGTFPEEKEENGEFERPFENYRWEFTIRKVEIPVVSVPEQEAAAGEGETPPSGDVVEAPANAQQALAQMVTKKINESVREVQVRVIWDELGEDQSLKVTTHVSKL